MRKDTLFSKVKKLMLIQPLANLLRLVPRSPTLDTFQTNVQRQVLQLFCMGVWQGVAMDSLTFHPGPPCPTFLRPTGGPPLKRPHGRFRGGSSAGQAGCDRLLPPRTRHALRLCSFAAVSSGFYILIKDSFFSQHCVGLKSCII